MSYIYTVKPIKEATEIAIKHGKFEVEENGNISIYGILKENWPAGVTVKSAERKTEGSIYNVGKLNLIVPLFFFTETEEKAEKEAPEFIKGLYDAMTQSCGLVSCEDCPLNFVSRHADCSCGDLIAWTKKRWFSK